MANEIVLEVEDGASVVVPVETWSCRACGKRHLGVAVGHGFRAKTPDGRTIAFMYCAECMPIGTTWEQGQEREAQARIRCVPITFSFAPYPEKIDVSGFVFHDETRPNG